MMLKTENVTLIEMMTNYGLTEIILEDQKDIAPSVEDEEEPKPPVDDDVNDEDIPPRQKRFWEDEE
jgi:hypothetical protein